MVVYLSFRKFSTVLGELFLGKTIQFNSGDVAAAERVTGLEGRMKAASWRAFETFRGCDRGCLGEPMFYDLY